MVPSSATAATPRLFASIGSVIGCTCPFASASRPTVVIFLIYFSFKPYLQLSFFVFLRPWLRVPPWLCGIFRDRIHKDRQHL